jgi:hypothetical protein
VFGPIVDVVGTPITHARDRVVAAGAGGAVRVEWLVVVEAASTPGLLPRSPVPRRPVVVPIVAVVGAPAFARGKRIA